MKAIGAQAVSARRAVALIVVAGMVVIPAIWIAWSLYAASVVAETVRSQSAVLAGLNERLAGLADGPAGAGATGDGASVHLPGGTAAVAGAALQRLVADRIAAAGGRLVESEFAPVDAAEEDPGRVDLRVSFETDIVGLQRVLYELESGLPILLVRTLTVQSPGATEIAAMANPPLRVDMLVGGFWEVAE
jgi:Type II secretion system (T2SS), protein M subtype b